MNEWEKFTETDREHDGDFKERKEKDWEDISKSLYLSAGDLALIAGCGIIGMVLGVWYWMLAALAVLYLYAALNGTCPNCGQAADLSSAYCSNCGKRLDEKEE